jgi:hypothetical protein
MKTELTGAHQATYDAIFQHPVARDLTWTKVRAMLAAIADSVEENGAVLKVVRNEKHLMLHRPARSGMGDIAELMKIRHFLTDSGTVPPVPEAVGLHLLVVINHRQASIYRTELQGTVPQRITTYDPTGKGRYLHSVTDDSNGQRNPERKSFYEDISKTLSSAEQILLFGSGTGASSAMEQLLAELKSRHPKIADRVVGSLVVDEQHLTENQLLAKARDFYAKLALAETTLIPEEVKA